MGSSSTNQRRQKTRFQLHALFPGCHQCLCAIGLAVVWALPANSASAQTNWINTTLGNWAISSNWSNGVPFGGNFATATIATGGTAFINSNVPLPSAGSLNLSSGGLTINNGATFRQFAGFGFGVTANVSGSAYVSGNGTLWSVDGGLYLAGNGTLRVESGADVENTDGRVEGSSVATITGIGSSWNNFGILYVGGTSGASALRIGSDGLVEADSLRVANTGSVEVNNGQSTVAGLMVNGGLQTPVPGGLLGSLIVANSSSGRMVVQSGGTVSNSLGTIGGVSGAVGSVLVQGANSKWTNTDNVVVGLNGNGTLEVRDGGTLTSVRGFAGAVRFRPARLRSATPAQPGPRRARFSSETLAAPSSKSSMAASPAPRATATLASRSVRPAT